MTFRYALQKDLKILGVLKVAFFQLQEIIGALPIPPALGHSNQHKNGQLMFLKRVDFKGNLKAVQFESLYCKFNSSFFSLAEEGLVFFSCDKHKQHQIIRVILTHVTSKPCQKLQCNVVLICNFQMVEM